MSSALIVVDMLSSYDFQDADRLRPSVERMLPALCGLIERAREREVKVVYVNDNYGAWHQGRDELLEQVLEGEHRHLIEPVAPTPDTDFVVKARHSVFYETPLEYLLREAGVERLIITGQVTEQCILYSALDAYIRKFSVHVPPDAVAHIHAHLAEAALEMMRINMDADLTPAAELLAA